MHLKHVTHRNRRTRFQHHVVVEQALTVGVESDHKHRGRFGESSAIADEDRHTSLS